MTTQFLDAIRQSILYWDKQDIDSKEKLEGLAFSILCMMDGVSGTFDGSILDLCNESRQSMFHEQFYEPR